MRACTVGCRSQLIAFDADRAVALGRQQHIQACRTIGGRVELRTTFAKRTIASRVEHLRLDALRAIGLDIEPGIAGARGIEDDVNARDLFIDKHFGCLV
jgi:hypothetical protein